MYWHELMGELEIIPAGECFLAGLLAGLLLTLLILSATGGPRA